MSRFIVKVRTGSIPISAAAHFYVIRPETITNMKRDVISQKAARRFLLSYHHLLPPRKLKGKQGILEYFSKVGCIQYDPLNIVGRNVELTLQSRVSRFRQEMLDQLLYSDRLLIDGWDKMMSILSTSDWAYFRRVRAIRSIHKRMDSSICDQVLNRIATDGPLSARDFSSNSVGRNRWGPRKMTSAVLDYLYLRGDLCVTERKNTQKIYDLAERLLPPEIMSAPDPFDSENAFWRWYCLRRIGSVGFVWSKGHGAWLGYVLENKDLRSKILAQLEKNGSIRTVKVEGVAGVFYVRERDSSVLWGSESVSVPRHASVLAPLDNLLWDRKLLSTLFGFDYSWEVYIPEKKRKYGYYVLPVLYGDRFVARFEPRTDKKTNTLTIKNWWWEKGIRPTKTMKKAITICMRHFLQFANVRKIEIVDQKNLQWMLN